MNTNNIVTSLETSKKFVEHNSADTDTETAEEIQSLLSACITAVQQDDLEEAQKLLNQIDELSPAGWDLTSEVCGELNN